MTFVRSRSAEIVQVHIGIHMSDLEFRPRYRFGTNLPVEEIKYRISGRINMDNPDELVLGGSGHHLVLGFSEVQQHVWTPRLDIDISEVEEGSIVRCLIGPAPNVWMLFMAGYLVITLIGLTGITLGMAQQMLGITVWGYLLAAPMPLFGVGLWLLAQGGKRRTRPEMRMLKAFVDRAMEGVERYPV